MSEPSPGDHDEILQSKVMAVKPAPARQWPLPEVRIVAIYFVCASLWIVGSDMILTQSRISGVEAGFVQSLKGLNFVITTAILLYLVLRRAYGGWRLAEQRRLTVIERASEKFRHLSAHVRTLQEEERTRIAREIHDQLGQLLTGIKMELRLVENRLGEIDGRALNSQIDKMVEISEMVDQTIESVRRISSGLRPSALDNLGLGVALMDEAVLFSERSGIPCGMIVEGLPEKLPSDAATAAFRIFQECLTNIARHAGARHVDGSVKIVKGTLLLTVRDDGQGIEPEVIEDFRSLGLIGMRERAENAGGHVVFKRNPTRGTEVIVTIPLTGNPGVPESNP